MEKCTDGKEGRIKGMSWKGIDWIDQSPCSTAIRVNLNTSYTVSPGLRPLLQVYSLSMVGYSNSAEKQG